MEFSSQYWRGVPFPSPVDHILSELSTMTRPSWVALHSMAHSFIELDKLWPMWSDWLVFCDCGFHSVCPLIEKVKRLLEVPDGRDWLREKLGLVLMGGAMLIKSLIQFSVDGWGCVFSLLFTWGQTMVEVMKIMATCFKRAYAGTTAFCALSCWAGHCQPTPAPETPGH